ncbi:MAG: class I SAM-dependent methyltransferase [Candidatus Lindowbacteria bacterium]|nr:class I SAM-dependent methyltransferase [Candidatus Lindowbacteria bacterium]
MGNGELNDMKWADLKKAYDIRAFKYEGAKYLQADRKHRVILDAVQKCVCRTKAKRVADAGCGNGIYIRHLASSDHRPALFGFDFSENIVRITRANTGEKRVAVGNLEETPYKSESFDVVLCAQVIEHMLDEAKAMRELSRVLHRNGCLVIATDNRDNTVSKAFHAPLKPFQLLAGLMRPAENPEKYFPHKEYSIAEFEKLVGSAGFIIESIITYRFSPPPPFTRFALAKSAMTLLEGITSKLNLFPTKGDIILAVCRKKW